jgi:hypothetical protein
MAGTRYQIKIDPLWQPLLLAGGVTPDNAYVELNAETIEVQFGWFFKEIMRRNDVKEAVIREWPLWMGVGLRTNLLDQLGLIGSQKGVVELRLHVPLRLWRVLRCKRVAISMERPGRFLEALAGIDNGDAG